MGGAVLGCLGEWPSGGWVAAWREGGGGAWVWPGGLGLD
jgi:hypothetical protein